MASSQAEGQGHCRVGGQQGLSKVGAVVLIWAVIWGYEGEWGKRVGDSRWAGKMKCFIQSMLRKEISG